MIKSFLYAGLENFFYDGTKKGINPKHAKKLERILDRLYAAGDVKDMIYPGSGLHLLEPRNAGRWAVKVTGNWRIIFSFKEGNAYDVDYRDYH
ncbi:MAG: hypothetical protein BWK80_34950 [Desulfobacteraceae bacterium IS3]|nr:MAG: hypothetical protein BWK80_34950 [Desulfobacteraceae bacterium IS3]